MYGYENFVAGGGDLEKPNVLATMSSPEVASSNSLESVAVCEEGIVSSLN